MSKLRATVHVSTRPLINTHPLPYSNSFLERTSNNMRVIRRQSKEYALLQLPNGQQAKLPVVVGSENEHAIDIRTLREQTGYVTLDDGYANTGACQSNITFIDGESGVLRYRGIPIEQIAQQSSFVETSYLLIYGNLPTSNQLDAFRLCIRENALIHEDMKKLFRAFPHDAHPMAILASAVSACQTYYHTWQNTDLNDPQRAKPGYSAFAGKNTNHGPLLAIVNLSEGLLSIRTIDCRTAPIFSI